MGVRGVGSAMLCDDRPNVGRALEKGEKGGRTILGRRKRRVYLPRKDGEWTPPTLDT